MNKLIIRIFYLILLLSLIFTGTTSLYSQNEEDYAIIYLIRLKKSTNSTVSYNAWIDDNYIGLMSGNNPVFTDSYTGKWFVFNCAAKQKRILKLTKLKDKDYNATIVFNTEKGKRYFIVFDPSVAETDNQLKLIDNNKGYEYLYKAASKDVVVVDENILAQVKYEKQHAYLELTKAVNENINKTTKKTSASLIDKLNINVANKNIENVNHKAIIYGNDEFMTLWKIIINNNTSKQIKEAMLQYNFYSFKSFDNNSDNDVVKELDKIILGIKDNQNIMIYYSESEQLIFIGIDKK